MILSTVLKLDAGAFTTGIGTAVQGVQSLIGVAGSLRGRLEAAFAAGGGLSDLAAQTGESAGALAVLRQAFADTGVGADALGQTLAVMRRAFGGISDDGKPTAKIFDQLGLSVEALRGMGAEEQLAAVGAAVNGLKDPSQQAAAAMAIFGRSGAKMMTFLKDPGALATARQSLGGLPALMDRNAAAFDAVADRMGRIREKGAGLWAGVAEGLLPLADQISTLFDGLDLTGAGRRIGQAVATLVQMLKDAPISETLGAALMVGFQGALNAGATGFHALGRLIWQALSEPLARFAAVTAKVIGEVMEMVGKIPWLGEKLGAKDEKAASFGKYLGIARRDVQDFIGMADGLDPVRLFTFADDSAAVQRLQERWQAAAQEVAATTETLQRQANEAAAGGGGGGAAGLAATKPEKNSSDLADALQRVGGYLGGGGPGGGAQARIATWTERTARGVERLTETVSRLDNRPAWGA
jgi:hypothetical protein